MEQLKVATSSASYPSELPSSNVPVSVPEPDEERLLSPATLKNGSESCLTMTGAPNPSGLIELERPGGRVSTHGGQSFSELTLTERIWSQSEECVERNRQRSVWRFFWMMTVFNFSFPLLTFLLIYAGVQQSAQMAALSAIGMLWFGLGVYCIRALREYDAAERITPDDVSSFGSKPSKRRDKDA
ncbi:hypothetical protein CCYA_CCYA17G4359 [Cyanidiococcus yangmingshanensis]|nr:hypothetical protein CCYA_CCYA17G4359 [Cyanidiococcus yangmingshanensis]